MTTLHIPHEFKLNDLAAAHADGRFVMIHIDHEFCMQYGLDTAPYTAFDAYNRDYQQGVDLLRGHHVPMIHVAVDHTKSYDPKKDSVGGRKLFASKIRKFYHNQDDMTVRAVKPWNFAKSYEKQIETDMLHTIKNGEIVLFKDTSSVHTNPYFEKIMRTNSWDVAGYAGQYRSHCIPASVNASAQHYDVFGIGDMIEGHLPYQSQTERIESMQSYLSVMTPNVTISSIGEVAEKLSLRL